MVGPCADSNIFAPLAHPQGDFTKMAEQFGENSFDAVYAFEATCHAPTLEGVYSEIYKVLKPGGMAGILEWVMVRHPLFLRRGECSIEAGR